MAPQIGPNDAPMMPNTAAALPALPESTRAIDAAVPMPQEMNGLTFGSVFLKLAAAISELKQAGGKRGDCQQQPEDFCRSFAHDRVHQFRRLEHHGFAGRKTSTVGAGYDQQRRAAGKDRRPGDTGQTAELNVFGIAIARSDIRARRTRRREKADDTGDCEEHQVHASGTVAAPAVTHLRFERADS